MLAAILETQLDYSAWASRALVEAASRLTAEELHHDFRTADGTVLRTLVHIFAADRIWLVRVTGAPMPAQYVTDRDYDIDVLRHEWPALHQQWKAWAHSLTADSVQQIISYTDLRGNPWAQPLWKIVLHVVNHGTHHRGQVAGFLRSLGHTPPKLDMIFFYRELEA